MVIYRRMKKAKTLLGSVALAAALALSALGAGRDAAPKIVVSGPSTNVVEISRDGEYTSREDVAAYVRKLEDRIQERRSGGEGAPRRLRRRG